ncbi:hypothetical protein Zmor_012150 [Zophobas morio]|uniref:Uncharacterized protein n=1 Tax=Zophobas morio TaxID=2755281 RepID=A0AA38LZH1_9CUCU|nr:hypothetical protein Zmor_012150 [Zophobas morio]
MPRAGFAEDCPKEEVGAVPPRAKPVLVKLDVDRAPVGAKLNAGADPAPPDAEGTPNDPDVAEIVFIGLVPAPLKADPVKFVPKAVVFVPEPKAEFIPVPPAADPVELEPNPVPPKDPVEAPVPPKDDPESNVDFAPVPARVGPDILIEEDPFGTELNATLLPVPPKEDPEEVEENPEVVPAAPKVEPTGAEVVPSEEGPVFVEPKAALLPSPLKEEPTVFVPFPKIEEDPEEPKV